MKNQRTQKGFTLIELMIVIAIIGILMAYAIPAYRDYSVKSKRGECNSIVDGLKTPMTEYNYNNNAWPTGFAGLAADGGPGSADGANMTTAVAANVVTCTASAAAGGSTIVWTASLPAGSGTVQWTCVDNTGTAAWNVCP